jgi:hypothetical protein
MGIGPCAAGQWHTSGSSIQGAEVSQPTEIGQPTDVSFRRDVMAVLSKAGCNLGTCHGNKSGKNGFKLSLRGQDPGADHRALSREMLARRIDLLDPDQSLMLRKATARMPHEGGRRFAPDSSQYAMLRAWIVGGARDDEDAAASLESVRVTPPSHISFGQGDQVSLSVVATFHDGTTRDVTDLAVYEAAESCVEVSPGGLVQRQRFGETTVQVRYLNHHATMRVAFFPRREPWNESEFPAANAVDRHVLAKLRSYRIRPSELCTDGVFLRRAYLDTLGILPTVDETRAFLHDADPDKRSRLVDALLERKEFSDHWALNWSDLLRNEEKVLDRKGVQAFHHWIRQSFAEHQGLDQFVYELIAARGSTYRNPATNFYRAHREPAVAAEAAAQLFLGVRLQCAKCHNHPFDRWTQDDYYNFSALFARVRYKIIENRRRDRFDKHEFDGEQIVWMDRKGEVKNPRTGRSAEPAFLGAQSASPSEEDDRLEALARWVTSADNPFFARMQANRIWYHLMGQGIVDPIDDVRDSNPPSNPRLLDMLADELIASKFDLRHVVRLIMNSHTYQLSSVPNETNQDDTRNFARCVARPLDAEPLLDSMAQVSGAEVNFNGYPSGIRAGQLPGVQVYRQRDRKATPGEQFLNVFGKPQRSLTCECERSRDATLGRAFQLTSGPLVNHLLGQENNRLDQMVEAQVDDEAIIQYFYLAALCRDPRPEEVEALSAYLAKAKDRRQALEDLLGGLFNSAEFLLRL